MEQTCVNSTTLVFRSVNFPCFSRAEMAFVRKIWEIVNDPSTEAVVHWRDSGESFVISDTGIFMAEIVPGYFKLKKFDSFCRQLNAYDFNKVRGAAWEFENANFKRGQPQLLANMKRKNPPRRRNEASMMIQQDSNLQIDDDDVMMMMDVAGIDDSWLNDLPDWEVDPIHFDGAIHLPGF